MSNKLRQIITMALIMIIASQGMITPVLAQSTNTVPEERVCSDSGVLSIHNPDCADHYGSTHNTVTYTANDSYGNYYMGVETEGRTAEQVHYDIYGDALIMESSTDQMIKEIESQSNQTVALAYAEAWNSAVIERNNGGSKSEAMSAARDSINDFYAMQQKSLFVQQDRQAQRLKVMDQTIEETEGLTHSDVIPISSNWYGDSYLYTHNEQKTLWNGESMNTTVVIYAEEYDYTNWYINLATPYDRTPQSYASELDDDTGDLNGQDYTNINFKDPQGKTIIAIDGDSYNDAYGTINDNRIDTLNNTQQIVDGIWQNCAVGECQPSDLGPINMIYSMSSSYDSAGKYSAATSMYGAMGWAGDIDTSYTIEWRQVDQDTGTLMDSQTASGQLYWSDGTVSNNTVERGVQYDTRNMSGEVKFIYQNGEIVEEETLTGTFTVTEITNPETGENLSQVSSQPTDYQTTNTTELNENIKQLLEDMEDAEERANSGGFNIALPSDGGLQDMLTGALTGGAIALGGIFVILMVILMLINAVKPY